MTQGKEIVPSKSGSSAALKKAKRTRLALSEQNQWIPVEIPVLLKDLEDGLTHYIIPLQGAITAVLESQIQELFGDWFNGWNETNPRILKRSQTPHSPPVKVVLAEVLTLLRICQSGKI